MTHQTKLMELAERCEAATGPSDALDGAIHEAMTGKKPFKGGRWSDTPRYTASLDAAMTLVPEGWFIYGMGENVKPIRFRGDLHEHIDFWAETQRREGGLLQKARGKTQALALCAAALRAMEEHNA